MNTATLSRRLASAAASAVITFCLASAIDTLARPPVSSALLAQAAATTILR